MVENKYSSISHADSLEAMGEFWDVHDFTEYDTDADDVVVTLRHPVRIERHLLGALTAQARYRGVSVETLVNLWLQQKLNEALDIVG
ncbi:MAG: hypothetical protein H7Z42_09880 [Roseiflexaceae bacterium]|nr:hypothetical protein [Roseiflexaceae bacterium]